MLSAEIFARLAEQGDPRAQTYLGVMYLRGQGVPQNFDAAAFWLHLASETGLPEAQYFLGLMYDKGQGVAQDFVRRPCLAKPRGGACRAEIAQPLGAHPQRGRLQDERGAARPSSPTGLYVAARAAPGV